MSGKKSMLSYEADGYCVAKELLPPYAITRTLGDIYDVISNRLNRSITFLDGLQELLEMGAAPYLATLRLCSQLASIQNFVCHPEVEKVISELGINTPAFQTGPVFHILSEQLKIPDGYFGIGPHQDYSSTEASKNGAIVWAPLCDIDDDFYPLEIIPGSHKNGLLPGTQKGHYLEVDNVKDEDFIKLNVKRGDVVFMSVFTVHRSCTKGRKGVRMSASIRYEDASEPSFIESGYPCKYKREYQK